MEKPFNVNDDKINTLFNILFKNAQDKNFKVFDNKTDKEILSVLETGNIGFNKTADNFCLCVNNNGVLHKVNFIPQEPPQEQNNGITPYAINHIVAGSVGTTYGPYNVPYYVQVGSYEDYAGHFILSVSADGTNWVDIIKLNIEYDDHRIDGIVIPVILAPGVYFKFSVPDVRGNGSTVFYMAPLCE